MWVRTHNSGVPRVSEATKLEHRSRLLEAAAAEFAAKGLDGARVDDISIAAGLAKGTIYNYFDSKQDVFREVIAAWFEQISNSRAPVAEDAPVREQLHAVVEADMRVTGQIEEFARVAFREVLRADPSEAEQLLPTGDPVDEAIVAIVVRGQASGELRSDRTAEELTRLFSTLVTGLLFDHWLPGSKIALDDIPDLVVDYYLDGAGA